METERTAITLAILSAFFGIVIAAALAARSYHRLKANKYAAKDLRVGAVGWSWDDYTVFLAFTFAAVNWILLVWAGFEGLGTDEVVANNEVVLRLFTAIQSFLIASNFVAKCSFALLVTRVAVSQANALRLSVALCATTALLGLASVLVVIVPCWPDQSATCYAEPYRWIFLAITEVTTEVAIMAWPIYALRGVQFRIAWHKWRLAILVILGRCCVIPLAISFSYVMARSTSEPFLGVQILNPLERQQGGLFASLFTSTLVPVFNLFQISKIEVFGSPVELNITKTVEVRMDADDQKNKGVESSAASLSPSQADTRELLDKQKQVYDQ